MPQKEIRIAVFVSGSGTNLQALIDGCAEGRIKGRIILVLASRAGVPSIGIAGAAGIPVAVVERNMYKSEVEFGRAIIGVLSPLPVDLICLAGFMVKVPDSVVERYRGRIINIHPALLPSFGGKGMFGMDVHRAVIESGAKVSGCTVHYVDDIYDHGEIIQQQEVPVKEGDTPESLAARVLEQEHKLFPDVAARMAELIISASGEEPV